MDKIVKMISYEDCLNYVYIENGTMESVLPSDSEICLGCVGCDNAELWEEIVDQLEAWRWRTR